MKRKQYSFDTITVAGSITNHKIYTKDGIVVEWTEPNEMNDIIRYYSIEWTIANQTHSENITYVKNKKNVFKVMIRLVFYLNLI